MHKRHETMRGIVRTSRRALLRSGAGLLAGTVAAQTLSRAAPRMLAMQHLRASRVRDGSSSRGLSFFPSS
jgi:hypothetical protein